MLLFLASDYAVLQFAYYWYHRMLHQPWSGPLYRAHTIGHHKNRFPVRSLRALNYGNEGGGWCETGGELVFGIPAVLSVCFVAFFFGWPHAIAHTLLVGTVAFLGDAFHSSYHLTENCESHPEGLFVHRLVLAVPGFKRLRKLHDIHHALPATNFGFVDFGMDWLFGTFQTDAPPYLPKQDLSQ